MYHYINIECINIKLSELLKKEIDIEQFGFRRFEINYD